MNDDEFLDFLNENVPNNYNIFKYLMVTRNKLREHRRIAVSYSAGSDSDIMADLIELVKPPDICGEIRYCFFDTGLEYDSTLRHIDETEQLYGITVERIKPKKSIPAACREHGVPFICKDARLRRRLRYSVGLTHTEKHTTLSKRRVACYDGVYPQNNRPPFGIV